jgi:triacylglycerol lipase
MATGNVPEFDPDVLAAAAFSGRTPLGSLREMITDKGNDFNSDEPSGRKAYIFACFSELAYLHHTRFDLARDSRYKVVPSEALLEMYTHDFRINLREMMMRAVEMDVTVVDPGRGFLYIVFRTHDFLVIAVRGTVILSKDVFIDLHFLKQNFNGYGYHPGFYREAHQALPLLQEAVDRIDANLPIYITGHSLGAAVAVVLRHMWGKPYSLMTPYVYATPRVGDFEAVNLTKVYSYIRGNDIVPRIAPESLGYSDLPGQRMIHDDDVLEAEWKILGPLAQSQNRDL